MIRQDYYEVLGVSRGENFRAIQKNFRDLANLYHPDRAGPGGTRRFQEIQQAYETLANAEKRKSYDDRLEHEETQAPPEPLFSRPPSRPEPLVPERMSLLHDFQTIRPSFAPLFERFVRNFTQRGIPKGERLEALNVEVIVSPENAAAGFTVPVGVPVFRTCLYCGGAGHDWLRGCDNCNGQGIIEEEETVRVAVRPVPDRSIIEAPIHGLAIHNLYLCFHIRISS